MLASGFGSAKSSGAFSLESADSSTFGVSGGLSFKTATFLKGSSGTIATYNCVAHGLHDVGHRWQRERRLDSATSGAGGGLVLMAGENTVSATGRSISLATGFESRAAAPSAW